MRSKAESKRLLVFGGLVAVSLFALVQVKGVAEECFIENCNNSTCRCSSTSPPMDMELDQIPQFVILTFDEAVTESNYPFYESLMGNVNPNGCNTTMTFFVSHENTDYTLVNKLLRYGHEISTHSVSALAEVDTYWRNMTEQQWINEINDMRSMLTFFGNIPTEDINGFRVPFLEVGGNLMYQVLSESGFEYDSSWPTQRFTEWYPDADTAEGTLWPYTLDYLSIQEKTVGTPPTNSFPGMWVNPMTDMQDNRGEPCPMLDQCQSDDDELETSSQAVFDLLNRNFKGHFYTNRSPFGLYTREAWFRNDDLSNTTARKDGFMQFLDSLSAYPEVYVVTMKQMIEWSKDPHSIDDLENFDPLQCSGNLPVDTCPQENHISCHYNKDLPISQSEIYMEICQGPCPDVYPWTGNPSGANITARSQQHV